MYCIQMKVIYISQWNKYFPNLLIGCLVMVGLSVMIFNIVWRMDEIVLRICQLAQNWQMKKDWAGVSECRQLKYSQTIWNNTNTTLIFSKSLSDCEVSVLSVNFDTLKPFLSLCGFKKLVGVIGAINDKFYFLLIDKK